VRCRHHRVRPDAVWQGTSCLRMQQGHMLRR
jgi:hypothetical protein